MHRHQLTDEQWDLVKEFVPQKDSAMGRPPADSREMLDGIMWWLRTGAPWRDLPERYGPWKTVYDRFNRWRKDGTYERIIERLQVQLDEDGKIDWDLWCVDGTSIRASGAAAGAGDKKGAPKKNQKTTHWVAQEADSPARSTWLLTVRACP